MRSRVCRWVVAAIAVAGCGDEAPAPPPMEPGAAVVPTEPEGPPPPPPVVSQVCMANRHTCVMRATGEVFCTGRNLDGQVGDGTAQTRWTWTPVVGVTGATHLACGASHTCAITGEGVRCWGQNAAGELGAGHDDPVHTAVTVPGITDATQLALGDGFSCARRTSGAVSCWGDGSNGRLGNGGTASSTSPVAVAGLSDAAEITAGRAHACARKADGSVVCWGAGNSGQLGQGGERPRDSQSPVAAVGVAGATHVAAGGNHTCALANGAVLCWGQNRYGQSGAGEENITTPAPIAELQGATQLALATSRTCAIVAGGAVHCWGYNNHSAQLLGVGSTDEKATTPTAVTGVTGALRLASAATGTSAASCAIDAQNHLTCWGTAGDGRFGNDEARSLHTAQIVVPDLNALTAEPSVVHAFPAAEEGLAARTSFEVGSNTVCGVREGRAYCFGDGNDGRLGLGSTRSNPANAAAPVAGLEDVVMVSTGLTRACALRRDGSIACWGQLSNRLHSSLPVPIPDVTGAAFISVGGHAGAMWLCYTHQEGGGVSCIGSPVGMGSFDLNPTPVEGLEGIVQVNVGTDSACALGGNGKVYCWGQGRQGQLGNGSNDRSESAIEVPGIRDAVMLGGGGYNNCAVRRNGALMCWGSGEKGQLTNGRTGREAGSARPVAIRGVRNVTSMGKGGDSMCAVQRGGDVMCWGGNTFGQTGSGDSETREVTTPRAYQRSHNEAVASLGPVVQTGCGWNFCCALHQEGRVSCAGSTPIGGRSGFLGISNQRSSTPIAAPEITFPIVD